MAVSFIVVMLVEFSIGVLSMFRFDVILIALVDIFAGSTSFVEVSDCSLLDSMEATVGAKAVFGPEEKMTEDLGELDEVMREDRGVEEETRLPISAIECAIGLVGTDSGVEVCVRIRFGVALACLFAV